MNKSCNTLYLINSLKELPDLSLPSESGRSPFDLSRRLPAYGVNLPTLAGQYLRYDKHLDPDHKTRDRYYRRLYRTLEKLASHGLVDLKKGADSLIWVAPNNRTFNLIREKHFSNFKENKAFPESEHNLKNSRDQAQEDLGTPLSRPRAHIRPERYRALQVARRARTLEEEDLGEIHEEYLGYRNEIDNTVLLFKRKEELGSLDGEVKTRPYETRFNSLPRKIGAEKRYKALWNNAGVMFNRGVFLTLTTDPKRHQNVTEANKAFGPALNRFMTWLRKSVKERGYGKLSYISANEFQKNGLLHAHIVVFGLPYLDHYKRISYLWSRTGQGEIVYLYSLRKDAKGWYWTKGRPKDAEKGQSCGDYLKKYISKNLQDDGQDLYWVFAKRFFTSSKTLEGDKDKPLVATSGQWVYIGSCHWSEVPAEVEAYNKRASWGSGPPAPASSLA